MFENIQVFKPFLIFVAVCALTFIFFRKKGEDTELTLNQRLLRATTKKVEKYLQKNTYITAEEMEKLIRFVQVRDPISRRMMRIDDPKLYTKGLIRCLLDQKVIAYAGKDGYSLAKKTEEN